MKKYLHQFLIEYEYNKKAVSVLESALDVVYNDEKAKNEFFDVLSIYSKDYKADMLSLYRRLYPVITGLNIHEYTFNLLMFICLSKYLKEFYIKNGIDLKIFHDTMLDLRYKLVECELVYGIEGSFVPVWFFGFFNLTRFALGRLQFELYSFKRNYTEGDIVLTPDSPCLNVHIPRTGGRLDREDVVESYKMAKKFFADKFNGKPTVFICHSWLLYDKVKAVLSPKSNIYAFADDYTVIDGGIDKDYGEVWRLFDKNYDGNVDNLPQDSSLRRKVAEMIKNNEKFGWGFGVYVFDK